MAAGVVLLLVVVGGVGGLTMRAFAGTARTVIHTKTVTTYCVYVDREHGGSSYGDLSAVPKYKHKVCITGKRGARGDTSVVTWNRTVAESSSPPSAGRGQILPAGVDLATVGPYIVRGYCISGEGVEAITHVVSAQDGSSFAWDDSVYAGSFNNGNTRQASNPAFGSTQNPGWQTEYSNGDFAVSTGDQATAFTGFANNGVYINGPEGPACSFTGYLVKEKVDY